MVKRKSLLDSFKKQFWKNSQVHLSVPVINIQIGQGATR